MTWSVTVPVRQLPRWSRERWCAVEAARTAVRCRDDLAVFYRSATLPKPRRQLQPAPVVRHLARALTEWEDLPDGASASELKRRSLELGLAPQPVHDMIRLAVRYGADRSERLRRLPVYVLTPDMVDVCIAAANTLDYDDIAETVPEPDLAAGFLLLPQPLPMLSAGTEHVSSPRALAWFPSQTVDRGRVWGPAHFDSIEEVPLVPTTRMMCWGDPEADNRLGPPMALLGDHWWSAGRHYTDDELAGCVATTQALVRKMRADRTDPEPPKAERVGSHTAGEPVNDHDCHFLPRFLLAFWRLCEQTITETTPQHVTGRGTRRQRADTADVRVVALRTRRSRQSEPDAPGLKLRSWSHRWIVSMHRRHQWYPNEGRHKIIFVGPYVKGPADRPLQPSPETVRALAR